MAVQLGGSPAGAGTGGSSQGEGQGALQQGQGQGDLQQEQGQKALRGGGGSPLVRKRLLPLYLNLLVWLRVFWCATAQLPEMRHHRGDL